MTRRIFGVTGWKNTGKTTLTERLVAELNGRGWRVSTVKHAHHSFDVDQAGTDSHRHREAGATEVAIVSGYRWALMHELRNEDEPALDVILGRLSPCDLVLVEGYKKAGHAKIETRRGAAGTRPALSTDHPNIVAIAADHPVDGENVPVFDLDDIETIADFVERQTGLKEHLN